MMFEHDEAPDPELGAPDATADRAGTATIAHPRHDVAQASPPRLFHPPAYRRVVAGWPEGWRERWGRRANELEEAGLSWRDAEAQAFVEVWNLVRQAPDTRALAPSDSDPERN